MEYNIYCDESCHLEHDQSNIMVIGGIRCPKNYRKRIIREIYRIKEKHNIPKYAEIKWTKVSTCNVDYFIDIVDFFFDCDMLSFRAVVVDKNKLNHGAYHQTHNEFYYKMYFYCLSGLISPRDENYIYIDKKDTRGTSKIEKLKLFIARKTHDFDQSKIRRIQCVTSSELPILQIVDLLVGAIGYHNRNIEHASNAKCKLVKCIQERSGYSLERSTFLSEQKMNLFFINLGE